MQPHTPMANISGYLQLLAVLSPVACALMRIGVTSAG